MDAATDRYGQIGQAMGIDMRGMTESAWTKKITTELAIFRKRVGILDSLAQRGVRSSDIAELSGHALNDACLVTNPRYTHLGYIKAIYGEAL
jgi:alcohol dehydrogenase class IV